MRRRRSRKVVPLKTKASRLRSSLRQRAGKEAYTPTTSELLLWLESQSPFKCHYFGTDVKETEINIDHKTPVTLSGTNELSNLCVTSSRVNRAKGQFTAEEFNFLVKFCKKFPEAKDYLLSRLIAGNRVGRKLLSQNGE